MKQWLRILPLPILIFCVMTFLDYTTGQIFWLKNLAWALGLTAIGCVGQYMIHKNILQDDGDENTDGGCNCCGKP